MDTAIVHPGFAKAVGHFLTQAELARALGVTAQYVSQCKFTGFSPECAIDLERITGGKLKAIELVRERHAA